MTRRGHHEIATSEAIGLLTMLVPLVWRPLGEKVKAIFRRPTVATKETDPDDHC